jgi:hypothetical protein
MAIEAIRRRRPTQPHTDLGFIDSTPTTTSTPVPETAEDVNQVNKSLYCEHYHYHNHHYHYPLSYAQSPAGYRAPLGPGSPL